MLKNNEAVHNQAVNNNQAGNGHAATDANTPQVSRAEGAQAMLDRCAAWEQEIPVFAFPVPEGNRRALRVRLVPPDFVEEMTAAMKGVELLSRGKTDPDEVRDLMQYSVVYGPVATAMERMAAKMRHSVETARAKAGSEALLTFGLAERLARVPGNTHLVPMVEALRRTLRTAAAFRGQKKSKKAAPESPSPQPVPTPAGTSPAPVTTADPHKP
jgi:hypothetical protein